jgi:hypothetical protein
MVEEQLRELRQWEASLLYPSSGGGDGGGGGGGGGVHDKNIQLLEELKQMKRERATLRDCLKEAAGDGKKNRSTAVDLFDENTVEVSRLDDREVKLNQWAASLQEQQALADEDATSMMKVSQVYK